MGRGKQDTTGRAQAALRSRDVPVALALGSLGTDDGMAERVMAGRDLPDEILDSVVSGVFPDDGAPRAVSGADDALSRIIADNDPRNGSVAERLIRMSEQPDRRPGADGIYPDARASEPAASTAQGPAGSEPGVVDAGDTEGSSGSLAKALGGTTDAQGSAPEGPVVSNTVTGVVIGGSVVQGPGGPVDEKVADRDRRLADDLELLAEESDYYDDIDAAAFYRQRAAVLRERSPETRPVAPGAVEAPVVQDSKEARDRLADDLDLLAGASADHGAADAAAFYRQRAAAVRDRP
jgi:hypothetical protein